MPVVAVRKSLANGRSILISGASIAGPTLAFWLHRHGFDVTLIEKASTVRGGGYPIDLRGNAMEVAERMGLSEPLRAAHIDTRRLTFADDRGRAMASIQPELITGGRIGRDVELPRGRLATLLFELTRERIDYRFNSSIASLVENESGVDVAFDDGTYGRFDLVIGTDGLHSNTRKLVFGPEHLFDRNIGFCFAGFEAPNTLGLSHEGLTANRPGQMVALYAPGSSEHVHVFFNLAHAALTSEQLRDPVYQRRLVTDAFADWGWLVPDLLRALAVADDLFFDEIKQIKMPRYSKGRVALAGDAAYAPSFLTGTGTSLAMVGAYVLASELAQHAHHGEAFAAYERVMRPFVAANHANLEKGLATLMPMTQAAIEQRNQALAEAATQPAKTAPGTGRAEYSMLDLSGYLGIAAGGTADRRPQVAILDDYAGAAMGLADWSSVRSSADVTVFDHHLSEAEAVEALQPFDVVCTLRERMAFPRSLIERLPNLKLIKIVGASLPNLDLAAASERGILVVHSDFAHPRFRIAGLGDATPELAWGLMMATVRNLGEEHRHMREGGWQSTTGSILSGKTLGLLGLGRSGKRMAQYAKVFGMEVIAWSQNLTADAAAAVGVRRVEK